jgi:hypothetical protein
LNRRAIAPDGTWGAHVAPMQAGDRVIVLSGRLLAAYDAADGRTLWAMESGQHAHGALVTRHGLLVTNEHYRPELLDLASGEVLAAWPMASTSTLGSAGRVGLIAGMDGSIWRIDLGVAPAARP